MESKFGIEEVTTVGTYANYNAAIGVNVANFNVHDVAMIVGMALHTDELRQQVAECQGENERTITHWKREVNDMQDKLTDAEIRVKEAQNDVRNAEAHSEEINKSLQHARAELQDERDLKTKFKMLSTLHYDNVEFIRELLNIGEDVGDEQFREVAKGIVDGIKKNGQDQSKAAVYWHDALLKIHQEIGGENVIDSEGMGDDEFVSVLCEHIESLRNASSSGEKQENYQRKYNELKGALGLAGIPHNAAVRLAAEKPIR